MTAAQAAKPTAQSAPTTDRSAQPTMKAIVQNGYGSPEKLTLRDVPKPQVDADTMLVRVRAASVNALDWHSLRMPPLFRVMFKTGLRQPKRPIPGMDVSGVVEAVGANVTKFKVGDEVIGHRAGAFAQYVRGKEGSFVHKPARISFEQAAAVPVAGLTALQGLRDHGQVRPGHKVLINGAGGGVGSFAVQVAKALGAHVTAVTGARSTELVRSLGADRVIDRGREDFTRKGEHYDVILDVSADRSFGDYRRALTPEGTLVMVGAPHGGFTKILIRMLRRRLLGDRVKPQKLVSYMAAPNSDDLRALAELISAGKLTPVVDRTFPLADAAAAVRYLADRRAQGKVVIDCSDA